MPERARPVAYTPDPSGPRRCIASVIRATAATSARCRRTGSHPRYRTSAQPRQALLRPCDGAANGVDVCRSAAVLRPVARVARHRRRTKVTPRKRGRHSPCLQSGACGFSNRGARRPRGEASTMSGNAVRLQAIKDVEAYVPPAVSFDATEAPGEVFGRNVFTKAEMQKRLPKSVYKSVIATIERGAKLDPIVADAVAAADEGLGDGQGRHALRARVLPAHRPDRGEARQLPRARRRRFRARRLRRQDPRPGRARRVELPERRPAQHVRGPRLHGLGRHEPGLRAGEPERQHAVHPDRLRVDDGRGARPQDAAAAVAAGDGRPRRAHPEAVRARDPEHVVSFCGPEQEYFLVDRHFFLARPDLLNSAARCSAASRRRARSSTTTTSAPSPSGCSAS